MKLAFLEFLASGPPDAVWNPDWGRFFSAKEGVYLVVYKESGTIQSAHWRTRDGYITNTHGPAAAWFWPCGTVSALEYHVNGRCHRADGPAIIHFDERGNVTRSQFIVNPALSPDKDGDSSSTSQL